MIAESTAATGVTIDGVKLKDSEVTTDVINEKTSATGVTIDGLLLKDAGIGGSTLTIAPATTVTGLITSSAGLSIADNMNIAVSNTTGTRVGTNNAQKIGFFGTTPVAAQADVVNATNNANNLMDQLNSVLVALRNYGLLGA